MKTRAAVLEARGLPVMVDVMHTAAPGPTEVVVRMTAAGLCHTDHSIVFGSNPATLPAVLGHEGAGVVEQVGAAVVDVQTGDTVLMLFGSGLRSLLVLWAREPVNCDAFHEVRTVPRFTDGRGRSIAGYAGLGTFAEHVTVDQRAVARVETTLPPEQLALVSCGVLTGFGAVLTAPVTAGSAVVVVGCGGVGLAAVQAARAVGASVIVAVDTAATKRDTARRLGATVVVGPADGSVVDAVRHHTGGRGADVAFEAAGTTAAAATAVRATRRGGRTVLLGLPEPHELLPVPLLDVMTERITIVGSIYGGGDPRRLIPTIVEFAERGQLDLGTMVSRTIGLDGVDEALRSMASDDAIRSVITFS